MTSWKHEVNTDVVPKISQCAGEQERWNIMKSGESKEDKAYYL